MAIMLTTGIASLDIILGAIALLLLLRLITRTTPIPKGLCLPPGPPGKYIIGNAGDMPKHREWVTFARWAKEYGDVVYLKVLGQPMVVINSVDIAYELFEKRSSIYSDRMDLPMMNDLMGWDWNLAFMRYGERWRRHRRLVHQKFHHTASTDYRPIQTKHTRSLLRRLYESSNDFVEHLRHTAGAIIMDVCTHPTQTQLWAIYNFLTRIVVYGIKVLPKGDPYIETAEKAMESAAIAGNPGAFLVDILPILKHVPEWFPGAGFRKQARIWRELSTQMSLAPFLAVKKGYWTARPSFTASFVEETSYNEGGLPDEEEIIRNAGSACYVAGSDTTVSALHTFILAMVLYPEVQRRAQAELDNVLGPDRLPEFEDLESFPYINAICLDVLRWHPVLPLGVAHRVTQDDVYRNYFIPEGALIIGNVWKMLHDEATYGPETDKFKPERFLVPGVKHPNAAFGFGGRICPGRHLADNSVFIAVASILKVFEITPARDNNGSEIPVYAAFASGFMSHPEPFRCAIKPRSESSERLILERTDE